MHSIVDNIAAKIDPDIQQAIIEMPKVELHVHIEGGIAPRVLLELAKRHNQDLPAKNLEELREWYQFTDFPHFSDIYKAITNCIRTPDDIEYVTKTFLEGQAKQNILHTEGTYTALGTYLKTGIPFDEQTDAIDRARQWAKREFDVSLALITDIPRCHATPEQSIWAAEHAVVEFKKGRVDALGLGGNEVGFPPEDYEDAFKIAEAGGLPSICHAGETQGAESIWGAIHKLKSIRIGHGVRCFEDPELVKYLVENQVHLEVNPSSNICLKVFDSYENHPLPKMIEAGLDVSINSDDPPMFSTTLTNELALCHHHYDLSVEKLQQLQVNAAKSALLNDKDKERLIKRLAA